MARTASITAPTPPDHQQMNRSNDPEETRAMDAAAPDLAMASRRQRLTGSAVGAGSVGFDDPGVYDGSASRDPTEGQAGSGPPTVQRREQD